MCVDIHKYLLTYVYWGLSMYFNWSMEIDGVVVGHVRV